MQTTFECPTSASIFNFEDFGAIRAGRALGDPLQLRFLPGTVLGVVGPNGVGKSSLLAAIAQAGVASFGAAKRGSQDLGRLKAKERAKIVAMLSQDVNAPDELRVFDLVKLGAVSSAQKDVDAATLNALNSLDISELATRRFGTLSGGQKQLVQLARVLAQNTPIVILDEPTSALDLVYQRVVEKTMRSLGQQGKVVIAALHDLSLALNACTQVLLLSRDGHAHSGRPEEVLRADLVHAAYGVNTTIHTTAGGRRFLATD